MGGEVDYETPAEFEARIKAIPCCKYREYVWDAHKQCDGTYLGSLMGGLYLLQEPKCDCGYKFKRSEFFSSDPRKDAKY